ncbi:MAG: DUF4012 domain-containing protein [Patescibacteria group bacterium]|nr:DUF4012 domain-containing protein [Patescibacteria group bacterium]
MLLNILEGKLPMQTKGKMQVENAQSIPLTTYLKPKKLNKKRWLVTVAIILGIILVFCLTLFLLYRKPATLVYTQAIAGKDAFIKAQEYLLAQDFENTQSSLNQALQNFTEARDVFKKFLWLQHVPWIGPQITAVQNLLLAGISTGQSIQSINDLAISIITPLQKDDTISLNTLSDEQTETLLKNIFEAKPVLEESKRSIDEAVRFVEKIPARGLLKKIATAAGPLKEKVPQLQSGIEHAINASQIIPTIAGYPGQKTYLFLLQNNTEMRPTGGFIGTYGILKVKNGDINYFQTDNIYNLDKPSEAWLDIEPPWPLTRYNAVQNWYLRDSNWAPHFPEVADKAEWFYHQERGQEENIDGVIAVTPTFIQSLLTLTGDIKVDGLTFTSTNLVDTLQYQVEQGFLRQGIDESSRKEIIGTLSEKILEQVLSLPKSKWSDLWAVFNNDLQEKQILLYIKDQYVQEYISKENWGGEIIEATGDYLAIIDANLASLKTDPVVKRTIDYSIQQDNKYYIATVSIKFNHEGSLDWKTTRYRTYTRVYVPQGSTLLSSSGSMMDCKINEGGSVETSDEFGKTSFGTFICIEPGEEKTLTFKYKLPDTVGQQIENEGYNLLVQKQPGAAAHQLNVAILINGLKKPREASNGSPILTKNSLTVSSLLNKDFTISFDKSD